MADAHETGLNIQRWKMKKLMKGIESARGEGSGMISLMLPPNEEVVGASKMLGEEASKVESGVILEAITSAQQRLKLYKEVPPNGLVLYTGTIVAEDGKEEKVTIDFEPFKPISASLYLCDNKFHTEALNEILESDDKFGFIVMGAVGALFGTLSGNTWEVLGKFSVDIPRGKRRAGESVYQSARIRSHMPYTCVRKTAEMATQHFIGKDTNEPNVAGLIIAGCVDFKIDLSRCDKLDSRLRAIIVGVVDVPYGQPDVVMFEQAIESSAEILENLMFFEEKRLIGKYLEEISQGTGKCVIGPDDTLRALATGDVEILIVWEGLDCTRYILKNAITGELVTKYLNEEQEANQSNFRDAATDAELQVQEKMPLLEWFANEYKTFGCSLGFVTDKSHEGSQFCRLFGGIGGILRYLPDMISFDELSDDEFSDDHVDYVEFHADYLEFHRTDLDLLAAMICPHDYSNSI